MINDFIQHSAFNTQHNCSQAIQSARGLFTTVYYYEIHYEQDPEKHEDGRHRDTITWMQDADQSNTSFT